MLSLHYGFAIHNWAKAHLLLMFNCHGLKPVAIDNVISRDFSPKHKTIPLLALLFSLTTFCHAQEIKNDTLANKVAQPADTSFIKTDKQIIEIESYAKRFDPRKALLYSAIFPGAGQFYNKKYWKMPLVYGGFAFLIYVTNVYDGLHNKYLEEFYIMVNDPKLALSPNSYTKEQLRSAIDRARRERDFFIILNGFWYILQLVDAHVDAHLKEFDLNPKMQVRLEPMMENSMLTGRSTGLALRLKF
jgi:Family of unknown function (DUF5683)